MLVFFLLKIFLLKLYIKIKIWISNNRQLIKLKKISKFIKKKSKNGNKNNLFLKIKQIHLKDSSLHFLKIDFNAKFVKVKIV